VQACAEDLSIAQKPQYLGPGHVAGEEKRQRSQRLAITLCWARDAMETVGIHGFELIILVLMIAVVALASLSKKLSSSDH
jgi:hypothetical protein